METPALIRSLLRRAVYSWRTALMAALFLVLLAAVYSSVPRAPRDSKDPCGTYVLDTEIVRGKLALNDDNTFSQTVLVKENGRILTSNGKWDYSTHWSGWSNLGEITLDNFTEVLSFPDKLDPEYLTRKPGIAIFGANYYSGVLTIGGDADSWPAYQKDQN
jgi:hypothetical protein